MNLLFAILSLAFIKCNGDADIFKERKNVKINKYEHCKRQRHALYTFKRAAIIYWHEAIKDENFSKILENQIKALNLKNNNQIFKFWLKTLLNRAFQNWTILQDKDLLIFQFIRSNVVGFYNIIQDIGQFIDLSKKYHRYFIRSLVIEIASSHKEIAKDEPDQLPAFDEYKLKRIISKAVIISGKIKQLTKKFSDQYNSSIRNIDYDVFLDEIEGIEKALSHFNIDMNRTLCYSKHNAIQYLYSDLKIKGQNCNKNWINCYNENYNFVQRLSENQLT